MFPDYVKHLSHRSAASLSVHPTWTAGYVGGIWRPTGRRFATVRDGVTHLVAISLMGDGNYMLGAFRATGRVRLHQICGNWPSVGAHQPFLVDQYVGLESDVWEIVKALLHDPDDRSLLEDRKMEQLL
jgi:hypothetical protein